MAKFGAGVKEGAVRGGRRCRGSWRQALPWFIVLLIKRIKTMTAVSLSSWIYSLYVFLIFSIVFLQPKTPSMERAILSAYSARDESF